MPTLTTTRFDVDAAGLVLVAEIENYLRTIPAPAPTAAVRKAGGLDLQQLLDQAARLHLPAPAAGRTVQPWHHPHQLPRPALADRLLGRRPIADVTAEQHLHLISAYIHRHGWTQGRLWDDTGAVCILGAQLRVLTAGFGTAHTAIRARQRIGNTLGHAGHPMRIDDWNDQPGRTTTDIHHVLNAAAKDPA